MRTFDNARDYWAALNEQRKAQESTATRLRRVYGKGDRWMYEHIAEYQKAKAARPHASAATRRKWAKLLNLDFKEADRA